MPCTSNVYTNVRYSFSSSGSQQRCPYFPKLKVARATLSWLHWSNIALNVSKNVPTTLIWYRYVHVFVEVETKKFENEAKKQRESESHTLQLEGGEVSDAFENKKIASVEATKPLQNCMKLVKWEQKSNPGVETSGETGCCACICKYILTLMYNYSLCTFLFDCNKNSCYH